MADRERGMMMVRVQDDEGDRTQDWRGREGLYTLRFNQRLTIDAKDIEASAVRCQMRRIKKVLQASSYLVSGDVCSVEAQG